MLKINKILLKKIKSPLSLRGAKQRSNLNGFSLIELMVAAVILSLAIFGIFQAFGTGFLGMFDSRDRTVATNYVQEKMEELKNADFDTVVDEASSQIFGDIKFSRNVNVEYIDGSTNLIAAEPTNLKRVTTTVNWADRNGVAKKVESSMLLQNTQFTPGDAARISLYADSYNVVLPVTDTTTIIAVIKDNQGNTIFDWDGSDVTFSIISGDLLGTLSAFAVTPVQGRASVLFTSSEDPEQGTVTVEASVTTSDGLSTFTDTIDIDVTYGAVQIELIPNPSSILADGSSQSTITAIIQNAAGEIVTDDTYNIAFTVSGEGILIGSTTLSTTDGEVTILLQATNTAGIATVTATSPDLFGDSCDVQTSGEPVGITITASPDTIYNDDTSTLTIKIVDINGVPVAPVGTVTVNLTLTSGSIFEDGNTVTFNMVSSQTRTFIPTGGSEGTVTITADDSDGILSSDSVDINVLLNLGATKIELDANPPTIPVDGGAEGTSTITATIKDDEGNTVHNYEGEVDFTILLALGVSGTLSDPDGRVTCVNGVATIELVSGSESGTCKIQVQDVSVILPIAIIDVGFYLLASNILLTAVPVHIPVGGGNEGTSKLTASIVDINDIIVYNYNGNVTFTFLSGYNYINPLLGNAKFKYVGDPSYNVPVFNGIASVDLISLSNAGVATLQASSDDLPDSDIPTIYIEKTLKLAVFPNITYFTGGKNVSFDIEIQGGDITIDRMKVTWSPDIDEELTAVNISIDGTISNNLSEEILSNGADFAIDSIILLEEIEPPITIKVTLTFVSSIEGKDISIIFYPAAGESYCADSYEINL